MRQPLPLIGRSAEVAQLRRELETVSAGEARVIFLTGESGTGKTRLLANVLQDAQLAGWQVASGRAYAAERGVPYSMFADALLPVFGNLTEETRTVITRGADAELAQIFPSMRSALPSRISAQESLSLPDVKNRLLWNFTQVVKALCARAPVLIVLDDLQWADTASLELLHFVARQSASDRLLIVCGYTSLLAEENQALLTTQRSLIGLARANTMELSPLSHGDTKELVQRYFQVDPDIISNFAALLYGWTRGNPFFITEVLASLVQTGTLRDSSSGWVGWDVDRLDLPRSIRDAIELRVAELSPSAARLAELLAAHGRQISLDTLRAAVKLPEAELLGGLAELIQSRVLEERRRGGAIWYDFMHPITREAFYARLGSTRAALLHAQLADALETFHGECADDYADELAFHFARSTVPAHTGKSAHYLVVAGRRALQAHANREAQTYFADALERVSPSRARTEVVEELARAKQRLGEYEAAVQLWQEALEDARVRTDLEAIARIERRLGLAYFWSGRIEDALAHFDTGLNASSEAHNLAQQSQLLIARAMCLQELGRFDEGLPDALAALSAAEQLGDVPAVARAHRALLLLHCWKGPPEVARAHGEKALALLRGAADRTLAWSVHWAMGVMEGLTGNAEGLRRHLSEAQTLATELRSPVLRLWCNELEIEYAYGSGEWNHAIQLGEYSISLARALNQKMLLPRLLVWTALMHLARDETVHAKSYIDEAWQLSGADRPVRRFNVHSVVPAHIGMAAYYLSTGDYQRAIEIGNAGLAIADSSGYVVWAVHRLMPVIAESHLYLRDVPAAVLMGERLRSEARKLDHELGLAWADACDALIVWLAGDPARGAVMLRDAAERLEQIPYVLDAARVRRQLAGRLADIGERDAAVNELRRVHDMLLRLGAERELRKTRDMFRELGARLPARELRVGLDSLTEREREISRMAAAGKANKSIAKALGISTRTVGAHLSNIFKKLAVDSRDELVAHLRAADSSNTEQIRKSSH